jgi:hypothetical protein
MEIIRTNSIDFVSTDPYRPPSLLTSIGSLNYI